MVTPISEHFKAGGLTIGTQVARTVIATGKVTMKIGKNRFIKNSTDRNGDGRDRSANFQSVR